jgi:hypothetical protein
MKIKGCRPVKINGKWDLEDYEREEEFQDSEIRHCDLCTWCRFPGYPECREWCNNGAMREEKS